MDDYLDLNNQKGSGAVMMSEEELRKKKEKDWAEKQQLVELMSKKVELKPTYLFKITTTYTSNFGTDNPTYVVARSFDEARNKITGMKKIKSIEIVASSIEENPYDRLIL